MPLLVLKTHIKKVKMRNQKVKTPYKIIKTHIKKVKTPIEVFKNTKYLILTVLCVNIEQ